MISTSATLQSHFGFMTDQEGKEDGASCPEGVQGEISRRCTCLHPCPDAQGQESLFNDSKHLDGASSLHGSPQIQASEHRLYNLNKWAAGGEGFGVDMWMDSHLLTHKSIKRLEIMTRTAPTTIQLNLSGRLLYGVARVSKPETSRSFLISTCPQRARISSVKRRGKTSFKTPRYSPEPSQAATTS